uniref:Uncharacterized protein n=1 Tax=Arundo donax TaxID=35708 RepID=A0A0A8YLZ5_ARUDO
MVPLGLEKPPMVEGTRGKEDLSPQLPGSPALGALELPPCRRSRRRP